MSRDGPETGVGSCYGWRSSAPQPGHAWIDPVVLELAASVRPTRVLDLGCGNGSLSKVLRNAGYTVVGCDPDPSGIEIARSTVADVRFEVAGTDDDPETRGLVGFDLVVSTEVIEHLVLPRKLLSFARGALRDNGWLILSTPYHGYLKNLIVSILGRWDGHHDVFWDHGHVKFFSPTTLRKMVSAEGFELQAFRGAGRLPFLWHTMIILAQKSPVSESACNPQCLQTRSDTLDPRVGS